MVTDVYRYDAMVSSYTDIYEGMEFDANGDFRVSRFTNVIEVDGEYVADGHLYMTVIHRDEDGVLTGMAYRAPEDLVYASE